MENEKSFEQAERDRVEGHTLLRKALESLDAMIESDMRSIGGRYGEVIMAIRSDVQINAIHTENQAKHLTLGLDTTTRQMK